MSTQNSLNILANETSSFEPSILSNSSLFVKVASIVWNGLFKRSFKSVEK